MTANNPSQSETITAENTFTPALPVTPGQRVSVSLSGVTDSTVTLQRRLDGANWRDVKNYTADAEETYLSDESGDVRFGVKTGNYGTDTITARVGVGGGVI